MDEIAQEIERALSFFRIQKALIMYIKEFADLRVVMDLQNDTDDQ